MWTVVFIELRTHPKRLSQLQTDKGSVLREAVIVQTGMTALASRFFNVSGFVADCNRLAGLQPSNTLSSVQNFGFIGILHVLGKSAQLRLVSLSALGLFIFSFLVSLPEWDAQLSHSIAQGIRVHAENFTCATWTMNFTPG